MYCGNVPWGYEWYTVVMSYCERREVFVYIMHDFLRYVANQ